MLIELFDCLAVRLLWSILLTAQAILGIIAVRVIENG